MAEYARDRLAESGSGTVNWIDLATTTLPACDAGSCYSDPNVAKVTEAIQNAQGILIATPIYNYNVASSCKNLIELTGKAWTDKVASFLCAAGGQGSYMACMGLANSLMLDFRTLILPRFVYATGEAFEGSRLGDTEIEDRINELAQQLMAISQATMPPDAS